MTRRSTSISLLAVAMASFGAVGCERAKAELETRQHILSARDSIAAYAAQVPASYPLQERWIAALRALGERAEPAAMQTVATGQLAPALEAYASALEAFTEVPSCVETQHRAMVLAHRELATAVRAFATGLDRRSYTAHLEALRGAIARFNDVQRAYVAETSKAYADFSVDVAPPPPVAR